MNLGGCHGNYNIMGVQNKFHAISRFWGTYVLGMDWVDFY